MSEAKLQADKARLSAQNVLMKTNRTKQKVDQSNEELRSLIRHIRDFLTRMCHFLFGSNASVVTVTSVFPETIRRDHWKEVKLIHWHKDFS